MKQKKGIICPLFYVSGFMLNDLENLKKAALTKISEASSEEVLRAAEIEFLGRKGKLTEILRGLKDLPAAEKGKVGKASNEIKTEIEQAIIDKTKELESAKFDELAESEWIDPTQPGQEAPRGTLHPLTQFVREAEKVFERMGFAVATGPQIEDDFHNFEALNIPADHPARDSQDTLFLENSDGKLLRTQTSSVQIRWMKDREPPFRIVAPGRVFRKDDFDASHSPMFHQLEGLVVDEDISLANMKAVMEEAVRQLINPEAKFRFRTSYFPFVEPGLEMDMSCTICGGKGCPVCKKTGWIEIVGCGLVHPNVLKNVDVDPDKWSGFAFGFGLDRMVMLRHEIKDLRLLFENDLRFLRQF
ncbi:MAG: phenylalanine--tRNA ligase subunit alpha [Candidatus Peribacteraceae bacterium]|nr:phenylalanine--tRNA ligase subunit alpha [Candidatus Peribacteraceae bacterium]